MYNEKNKRYGVRKDFSVAQIKSVVSSQIWKKQKNHIWLSLIMYKWVWDSAGECEAATCLINCHSWTTIIPL